MAALGRENPFADDPELGFGFEDTRPQTIEPDEPGQEELNGDDDDDDLNVNDLDDLDALPSGAAGPSSSSRPLTGAISGGEIASDRRFAGGDTLDEPVWHTVMRDVRAVGVKVRQVLWPRPDEESLKTWDLWGPLVFCLFLALFLSIGAPETQASLVFSGIFTLVWFGEVVVTLNLKLLGGKISFFQGVSVLGYCLFPLLIASFVSIFVHTPIVRLPLDLVMFVWSSYASISILKGSRLQNRLALAVYPLLLFFFALTWLVFIT